MCFKPYNSECWITISLKIDFFLLEVEFKKLIYVN